MARAPLDAESLWPEEKTDRKPVQVTVYMPKEMHRAVKHLAVDTGKTMNSLILDALKKELDL